jgi:hypothetical protein
MKQLDVGMNEGQFLRQLVQAKIGQYGGAAQG